MGEINLKNYQAVHPVANTASKVIVDVWKKLGQPQTPFSDSGRKMMNVIIAVWEDLYPLDMKIWYEQRKDYQKNEMSAHDQIKHHTGRSLASYPLPIYNLMKAVFRGFDPGERKNCMAMVKEWPQFRMANKA